MNESCPQMLSLPYTCDKLGHGRPEQLPVAGVQAGAPHAAQYLGVVLEVETRHV